MLRTNRIFKLLFQFREDLGTSSPSGLQGGATLLHFTRCCCEHKEELFFSLEGRDGVGGGGGVQEMSLLSTQASCCTRGPLLSPSGK